MKNKSFMPTLVADMPTYTAEKVRRVFSPVMGKVEYGHTPHLVTNRGKPSMVWIGADDYEDMLEMIETMAEELDPEFQLSLIEGKKEIEAGDGVSEDELDNIINARLKNAK